MGLTAGCSSPPASISSWLFLSVAGVALVGLHWLITKLQCDVTTATIQEDNMMDNLKASNFRTLTLSTLTTIWAAGTSLAATVAPPA
jgi:hypothetical protein